MTPPRKQASSNIAARTNGRRIAAYCLKCDCQMTCVKIDMVAATTQFACPLCYQTMTYREVSGEAARQLEMRF